MAKKTKMDTNKFLNFSIFMAIVIILLTILAFLIYLINIPAPDPDILHGTTETKQKETEDQAEPEATTETNFLEYRVL